MIEKNIRSFNLSNTCWHFITWLNLYFLQFLHQRLNSILEDCWKTFQQVTFEVKKPSLNSSNHLPNKSMLFNQWCILSVDFSSHHSFTSHFCLIKFLFVRPFNLFDSQNLRFLCYESKSASCQSFWGLFNFVFCN